MAVKNTSVKTSTVVYAIAPSLVISPKIELLFLHLYERTNMLKTRFQADLKVEIGVDEAGRGPLWGPLMAAAIILPNESSWTDSFKVILPNIKDSKKLSAKKRETVAKQLEKESIAYGIGIVSAAEIDTLGATRANQLAFRRAIEKLEDSYMTLSEKRILIDGILPLNDQQLGEEIHTIVDGDATYLAIAAASILAKVSHDAWVVNWCKENIADATKYDLLNCKGYGTAKHREGILKYGYTDLHRRLYLRKLIPDIIVSRYQIMDDYIN
jgi:ribonuclease HII